MTDFFKDVFEAAQQRIRSPFIGSVIFAFIAVNWQALFYLFFADVSVQRRIDCFNDMTSNVSLYWLPLGIGAAMAIVLPFLRVGFAWIIRFANRKLHKLQAEEAMLREVNEIELAVKKTKAEADLAAARAKENLIAVKAEADLAVARAEGQARVQEVEELSRIEAAKRDAAVKNEVSNEEVAEKLQEELEKGRDPNVQILNQLSERAKELLEIAAPQGQITHSHFIGGEQIAAGKQGFSSRDMERREWSKYVAGLEQLVDTMLLRSVGNKGQIFEVTSKGYDVADLINEGEV